MKPCLVFPFHDPLGNLLPHLQTILPDLKAHFSRAYICPPYETRQNQRTMRALAAEPFFTIFPLNRPLPVGEHFKYLYQRAAEAAAPETILHLAYVDRLAFALQAAHRDDFLAAVDALRPADLPLIFHRSPAAWATHPVNYARLEAFVTRVGQALFGRTIEYGWCHLVVQADELRRIMPMVTHPGLSMVAEMVLQLQDHLHTRPVDWLAWEDPFVLGLDAVELKAAREVSSVEYEKRLSYCLPMVEALIHFSQDGQT